MNSKALLNTVHVALDSRHLFISSSKCRFIDVMRPGLGCQYYISPKDMELKINLSWETVCQIGIKKLNNFVIILMTLLGET